MILSAEFEIEYPNFSLKTIFRLEKGMVLGIWGPSGAGKTSILNCISGITKPGKGVIKWGDQIWFSSETKIHLPPEKRSLGFMMQEAWLFPHLNVEKNLKFAESNRLRSRKHVTEDLIHVLQLETLLKRFPKELSGGEKQRVSLGRAIMRQPDILVLDEPFAALDYAKKKSIISFLSNLDQTMIMVSHQPSDLELLTDEVLSIHGGKTQQMSTHEAWREFYEEEQAYSVHHVEVTDDFPEDHLCTAECDGVTFFLPSKNLNMTLKRGDRVQVKLKARDISIGLKPSEQTSILNCIPVTIVDHAEVSAGMVLVRLTWGNQTLYAHITIRSKNILNLQPGMQVFASIKGMAIQSKSRTHISKED